MSKGLKSCKECYITIKEKVQENIGKESTNNTIIS